jgi:hypothetical protein
MIGLAGTEGHGIRPRVGRHAISVHRIVSRFRRGNRTHHAEERLGLSICLASWISGSAWWDMQMCCGELPGEDAG